MVTSVVFVCKIVFTSILFTAYFPQDVGTYPVVLFLGGWNGYILVEFYETVLYRIASHGFIVFGIDNHFPVENLQFEKENNLQQDISKIFNQYTWVRFPSKYRFNSGKCSGNFYINGIHATD